jgi:hypothetical protein
VSIDDVRLGARLARAALLEPTRPLMVNLVVTRRCNLSCGYCTEYDDSSPPVPRALLEQRLDHLARLRTVIVTLTGGEPLCHPEIADVVASVRARAMTPALNTNGFLLTRSHIDALNRAGLYAMQLSLDALTPNAVTKKALRSLAPKLRLLAAHARFKVRVNTVLGAAPAEDSRGEARGSRGRSPRIEESLAVVRAVVAHGFEAKVALLRRSDGTVAALTPRTRAVYAEIERLAGRRLGLLSEGFQRRLLDDGEVAWRCRAGARFFHVCERDLSRARAPASSQTPTARQTRTSSPRCFDRFATGRPTSRSPRAKLPVRSCATDRCGGAPSAACATPSSSSGWSPGFATRSAG